MDARILLLAAICVPGIVVAGESFGGIDGFEKKESGRFVFLFKKELPKWMESTSQKVWKETDKIFPERLPSSKDTASFRIVLASSNDEYLKLVKWYVAQILDKETKTRLNKLLPRVRQFQAGSQNYIFMPAPPNEKIASIDKEYFTHSLATSLLRLCLKTQKPPLWVTAGYGYHMDFTLNKKAVTRYIDYSTYTPEGGNKEEAFNTAKTFESGEKWGKAIKKLMKKDATKGSILKVVNSRVESLTPETVGYMYAFTSFCLSTKQRQEAYLNYLDTALTKEKNSPQSELPKAFGCENLSKLESQWHSFIKSGTFK